MIFSRLATAASLFVTCAVAGCTGGGTDHLRPALAPPQYAKDALALHDRLEALVDAGTASEKDRTDAYNTVIQDGWNQPTAEYAFSRAAIAGRLAQLRGASAAGLIQEMERWTRQSYQLNPKFRQGAARRMLGTIYVLAPGTMLKHGDSEKGLELLSQQAADYPAEPRNHLRLAQAFLALDDLENAVAPLCRTKKAAAELKGEDRRELNKMLVDYAENEEPLDCSGAP